jgi:hypothetical protein
VSLRFDRLDGYGWVFPKREYISVDSPPSSFRIRVDSLASHSQVALLSMKIFGKDFLPKTPHYLYGTVESSETDVARLSSEKVFVPADRDAVFRKSLTSNAMTMGASDTLSWAEGRKLW